MAAFVFDHEELSAGSAGSSAEITFNVGPFKEDALVMLTASGRSTTQSQDAGTVLFMVVNGEEVCHDGAFAPNAGQNFLRVSASHNFVLAKNDGVSVRIQVSPEGGGSQNNSTQIKGSYVALAVEAF